MGVNRGNDSRPRLSAARLESITAIVNRRSKLIPDPGIDVIPKPGVVQPGEGSRVHTCWFWSRDPGGLSDLAGLIQITLPAYLAAQAPDRTLGMSIGEQP